MATLDVFSSPSFNNAKQNFTNKEEARRFIEGKTVLVDATWLKYFLGLQDADDIQTKEPILRFIMDVVELGASRVVVCFDGIQTPFKNFYRDPIRHRPKDATSRQLQQRVRNGKATSAEVKAASNASISAILPLVHLLNKSYAEMAPKGSRCRVMFVCALLGEAVPQLSQVAREVIAEGEKVSVISCDSAFCTIYGHRLQMCFTSLADGAFEGFAIDMEDILPGLIDIHHPELVGTCMMLAGYSLNPEGEGMNHEEAIELAKVVAKRLPTRGNAPSGSTTAHGPAACKRDKV